MVLLAGCDFGAKTAAEAKHREMERTMAELKARVASVESENRRLREEVDSFRRDVGPMATTSAITLTNAITARCTGSDSSYRMRITDFDETHENLGGLARDVRIVPAFEGGVARGFKLYSIRPESLLASCGLQNGDVLRSINGLEMNSPDKALEVYAKVKDAERLDLRIERKGVDETVTIHLAR